MTEQPCHWTGEVRAIGERHDGPHDHCTRCPRTHCAQCGATHTDEHVCARCIGRVRTTLTDIAAMYAQLGDEALEHPNDPIPGGAATVLTGPGSLGESQQWAETQGWDTSHKHDEYRSDPVPILLTLATWEDAFRDTLGWGEGPRPATVENTIGWLSTWLHELAKHEPWLDFVGDIGNAHGKLEVTLQAGNRPLRGVRCLSLDCDGTLLAHYQEPTPCTHDTEAKRHVRSIVREQQRRRALIAEWRYGEGLGYPIWPLAAGLIRTALRTARYPCEQCDQGGRRDEWRCSKCHRRYDDETYRRAVKQDVIEHDPLRTAHQLARDLGVTPGRIRQWINRGALAVVGHNRGRKLYDIREGRRRLMRGDVA